MSEFRVAILVSGRGSNMSAVLEAWKNHKLPITPCIVLSDNPQAPAIDIAKQYGVPTDILPPLPQEKRAAYAKRLITVLDPHKPDLIVLAGFMRILDSSFVDHFKNKIINIHPSLLPSFPGLHAQKQSLDHGVRVSGATVHFVDGGCDTGPIILQASVPVFSNDTEDSLSARILVEEHRLLPKAIDLLARNKVQVLSHQTRILEEIT